MRGFGICFFLHVLDIIKPATATLELAQQTNSIDSLPLMTTETLYTASSTDSLPKMKESRNSRSSGTFQNPLRIDPNKDVRMQISEYPKAYADGLRNVTLYLGDLYLDYDEVLASVMGREKYAECSALLSIIMDKKDINTAATSYKESSVRVKKAQAYPIVSGQKLFTYMAVNNLLGSAPAHEEIEEECEKNPDDCIYQLDMDSILEKTDETRRVFSKFESKLEILYTNMEKLNNNVIVVQDAKNLIEDYGIMMRTFYGFLAQQFILVIENTQNQEVYSPEAVDSVDELVIYYIEGVSKAYEISKRYGYNVVDSAECNLNMLILHYVIMNADIFSKDISNGIYFKASCINTTWQIRMLFPLLENVVSVLHMSENEDDVKIRDVINSMELSINAASDSLLKFNPYYFDMKSVNFIQENLFNSIAQLLEVFKHMSMTLKDNVESLESLFNSVLYNLDFEDKAKGTLNIDMQRSEDKEFVNEVVISMHVLKKTKDHISNIVTSLKKFYDGNFKDSDIFNDCIYADPWNSLMKYRESTYVNSTEN
ncbi:hypothetical protein NEAUS03_0394 [Nematocida ausubeli]|nr:hypothetical protein NEAUS03_0394 [Nematocida ausubeli]